MASLLLFLCLFIMPALITWGIVRLTIARRPAASRRHVLGRAVPLGAILPLLPFTWVVASATNISNALPIAIAATLIGAIVLGLCICLPVGLALTRDL